MVTHVKGMISGTKEIQVITSRGWSIPSLGMDHDNPYKLDYNIRATFNVSDLSPFDVGDDLRSNPLEDEGNDEIEDKTIPSTWDEAYSNSIQVLVESGIRAHAKKFKKVEILFSQHKRSSLPLQADVFALL